MNLHMVEHIIAGLGIISMLLHALEAGCNHAGFTKYEGIFQKLGAFVEGFMGQIKPPTAGGSAAVVIFVALLCSNAHADTFTDTFKALNPKDGVMVDFQNHRALNYAAVTVFTSHNINLSGGLVSTDGVGASITYDLKSLPVSEMPVLKVLQYAEIGWGVSVNTITMAGQRQSSDNQIHNGPVALFKFTF